MDESESQPCVHVAYLRAWCAMVEERYLVHVQCVPSVRMVCFILCFCLFHQQSDNNIFFIAQTLWLIVPEAVLITVLI